MCLTENGELKCKIMISGINPLSLELLHIILYVRPLGLSKLKQKVTEKWKTIWLCADFFSHSLSSKRTHLLDVDRKGKHSLIRFLTFNLIMPECAIVTVIPNNPSRLVCPALHSCTMTPHRGLYSFWQHPAKLSVSIHPSHHLPIGGTEVMLFVALWNPAHPQGP